MAALGIVAALCVVSSAAAAGRAGENLVHNSDFEIPSPQGPPPGWVMWGDRQYKVAAHFTRDTTSPHGGRACFRIHHPSGTAGYVVSDPARAIRAKKGMAYRVSFWARTDVPGPSVFYIEAYESVRPYRDAPSPGRWPIRCDGQWRSFAFEVHEGRDFLADRSRLLLLAFRATLERPLQKTLWIDDVVVTESRSTVAASFVDEGKLEVAPLRHRLKPGRQLAFAIDVKRRIGPAGPRPSRSASTTSTPTRWCGAGKTPSRPCRCASKGTL